MRLFSLFLYAVGIAHGKVSFEVGSDSASIEWSESGNAELFLQRLDNTRSLSITEKGRNGQHTLTNLVPGAIYRLDVTPRDGERQTVKFNTKPEKLPGIKSSKFFRSDPDGENNNPIYGAVLYWTPPVGSLDGYVVDIFPKHGEIKAPVLQKNGNLVSDDTQPRRVVTGLEPGEEYTFTVSSTSGREVSTPTTLSTRIPPETPAEIEVSDVNSRGAVLNWQREHRGYLDGFYMETSPPDGDIIRPGDETEKAREITGLKPGKRYGVKVHSTAYGLLSFRPSERSIITLPEAPLGDLVVISQDPINVTLSWTPPDGEVHVYHIIYYPTKADSRKLKELSINSTITLTNMTPGTEYNFEIESVSHGIHSDPMTGVVTTLPDAVEDLRVVDQDFTYVALDWSHSSEETEPQNRTGSPVISPDRTEALYVVSYSPYSKDSWPESPFITKDSMAAVEGLQPGITIKFEVKAIIGNVESEPEAIRVKLDEPVKPSDVTVVACDTASVTFVWSSPYPDALYVVNVFDQNAQLSDYPQTTSDTTFVIGDLDQGSVYQVTVATVVEGFTTDKHAMQVETIGESTSTILYDLDQTDVGLATLELNNFADAITELQPTSALTIDVGETQTINGKDFLVTQVIIAAKPSDLNPEILNDLWADWLDNLAGPGQQNGADNAGAVFSDVIDTEVDECKKKNDCSANAICQDQEILYSCTCKENYADVTNTVVETTNFINLSGQVCVADPTLQCVRTNWRFARSGYLVVRRKMPAVSEYTVCFGLQLNAAKLRGTVTSYYMDNTKLLLYTDDKGNLVAEVNDEKLFAAHDAFSSDLNQKVCLTASDAVINLYIDGEAVFTVNPSDSVALLGGGKVQIGNDPACDKRCERTRGVLAATIEDFTIWQTALNVEQVRNFTSEQCITGGAITLEDETVDQVGGANKPIQESTDEIFADYEFFDNLYTLGRMFTTLSPLVGRFDATSPPTIVGQDSAFSVANSQAGENDFEIFETVSLESQGATTVEKLVGAVDDLETFCKPDNMTIVVQRAFIDEYEAKYGPLTLEDPACGRKIQGDLYAWEISPDLLGCGSSIELSETHVTFVNSLSNKASEISKIEAVNGIIFGNQLTDAQTTKVSMAVSCKFPLDYTVTADYPFLPQITMQIIKVNVSGHGEFSAIMQLYEDDTFTQAFESSPEIEEGELLNVGISLLDTDDPEIRLSIMDCWATPYQDANGVLQHHLIEEGCGVENVLDGTLKIYENGKSKMSKFAGSVFKFVGYNQVWLHCNIRVCFGDENCSNQCENGNRRRRDAEEDETIYTVSTAHPIRKIELDIELDQISINGNQTPGESLITGLIAGVTALTLLLLNAIGLIILRRRRTKTVEVMIPN